MGKSRIIAETGAGQHGVATATVCALFDIPCTVFMGAEDIERQKPNVFRMKLLGAEIVPVTSGSGTLKDAMNEALRHWVAHVEDTYYLIGTVAGPHPFPENGTRLSICHRTRSPYTNDGKRRALARYAGSPAIGGGSNAMGLFHPFLDDSAVQIGGRGSWWIGR